MRQYMCINICVIRAPEGEEKQYGRKKNPEDILAKKFLMMKNINL